jgi:hypothetical protein
MTQDDDKGTADFQTGTACTDSNLYRCSENNFEIIQFVEAGEPFPNSPFGEAKNKTTWTRITLATDGGRTAFDGRKMAS